MSQTVKIRSPKGLTVVRRRSLKPAKIAPGRFAVQLTAKLVSRNLARLKKVAEEAVLREPWAQQLIAEHKRRVLVRLKKVAEVKPLVRQLIGEQDKSPLPLLNIIRESRQADRAYFGACMLSNLNEIEYYWRRHPDAIGLVQAALALADNFRSLIEVENEPKTSAVLALQKKTRAENANRHERRAREWAKWNQAAQSIWQANQTLSAYAVAKRVKMKLGLTESVSTIRKRLKKVGKAR